MFVLLVLKLQDVVQLVSLLNPFIVLVASFVLCPELGSN